jgi:hypothetical protein
LSEEEELKKLCNTRMDFPYDFDRNRVREVAEKGSLLTGTPESPPR